MTKAHAANSYIPELTVQQSGSAPKIEIGIDMDDADVFYRCNFTDESRIDFCQSVNNYGHQSITSEDYYSGGKSLKCYNNKSSRLGNHLWSPMMSDANESHFIIKDTCRAPNMSWVSVTFKAKSRNSNSTIASVVGGKEEINYGIVAKDWNNHIVKYKNNTDWRQAPNKLYVYADEGPVVFDENQAYMLCTSREFGYFTCIWYRWNYNEQCFYSFNLTDLNYWTDTRRRANFNAGETLLMYEHAGIFPPNKEVPGDNQWHTYSCNVRLDKFAEHPDQYDYYNQGVGLEFCESTDGTLYIDDIKFGKASKVEIVKDDSSTIYSGYGSEFTDNSVVVKPNAPVISSQSTLKDRVRFNYSAPIKQEIHNYKARSLGSSGNNPSAWSRNFPVTLTSTPSKYHIKLYKNNQLVRDEDTSTTFEYTDVRRGDRLTGELYTIDTRNQKSSSTAIDYTVGQTVFDLNNDINDYVSGLDNSNSITDTVNDVALLGLRTNVNIPFSVDNITSNEATKYNDGTVNVDTTIDGSSKSYTKTINKRPEYQTKDEFKYDITNYINDGNIESTLDYNSFGNAKETLENKLNEECKDNLNLNDVEIDIKGTSTEFTEGEAQVDVYYKK